MKNVLPLSWNQDQVDWSIRPRPGTIDWYSNMVPSLSGQDCKFVKFPLSLSSQETWIQRKTTPNIAVLSWKPPSHVKNTAISNATLFQRNFCLPFAQTVTLTNRFLQVRGIDATWFSLDFALFTFFALSHARLAFDGQCISHDRGHSSSYWYFSESFWTEGDINIEFFTKPRTLTTSYSFPVA